MINRQNAVFRDDQTGSWWQQATGEAIRGPLAGQRLEPVPAEQVSFEVFRRERPSGLVLEQEARHARGYDMAMRLLATVDEVPSTPLWSHASDGPPTRSVVVGVVQEGEPHAYLREVLEQTGSIEDAVGGVPLLLVLGEDRRSIRVFDRRVRGEALSFRVKQGALTDRSTGSRWDFQGVAREGPLEGARLEPVPCSVEFWFSWKEAHPESGVGGGT